MEWLTDPQTWIAFVTLVVLELVLGVDNVIFVSILADRLPAEQGTYFTQLRKEYPVRREFQNTTIIANSENIARATREKTGL